MGSTIAPVDPRSINLLELPAIRERLAALTGTPMGADLARGLTPSVDAAAVGARQTLTAESIELRRLGQSGPRGAEDVSELAVGASRGEVLEAGDIGAVGVAAGVASESVVSVTTDVSPALAAIVSRIDREVLDDLSRSVMEAIDERGAVRDDASPELAAARSGLVRAEREAADEMRAVASRVASHLQETFVTARGGRPVLAVKASSKSAVPGIVHDSSGSGQTLFVEPLAVIEANNRVRDFEAREREEVRRVLTRLSTGVGEAREPIVLAVQILAQIDVIFAGAELAAHDRSIAPEVADEIALTGARHPLLDPARTVPVDIDLTGLRVLIVTGPNTGGKTVALKTLGLFALMHQCGLHVPAKRARLPIFSLVVADIGDDQSIARSLSTFSGHLRSVIDILGRAGRGSLILMDEIMAGTDAIEGAALATAILERLSAAGAIVVATSHSAELKAWAAERDGVANAAVGFNPNTLQPTYALTVGEPGPSHAIHIAEGFGLDPEVVAAARGLLDPTRRRLEALLTDAERARSEALDDRAAAAEEREAAAKAERDARRRSAALAAEVDRVKASAATEREVARREAERELSGFRAEISALRREIAAAKRSQKTESPAERDRRLGAADAAVGRAGRQVAKVGAPLNTRVAEVGDRVVDQSGLRGQVIAISGDVAEVEGLLGVIRVPLSRLTVDGRSAPTRTESAPERRPELEAVFPEIDVRGQRAEVAKLAVREYIDRAAMVGLSQLRVIHGHGTGVLRVVIREELARHPLVGKATPAPPEEGGDGATLVMIGAEEG